MEETTTEEEDAQTRFERPVERLFPAILPILPAAARYGTHVQESELLQQQQQQESWLSNPSFSESLLPPPPPPPTRITVTTAAGTAVDAVLERETVAEEEEEDEEDEQLQQQKHKHKKHSSKKKEDRRKKRKERKPTAAADDDDKHIGSLQGHALDRKNAVKIWADRNAAHLPREYYLDSRGDRDNLAFGSLYRMDIARYHREQWEEAGGAGEEDHKNMRRRRASLDVPETDGAVHQEKVVLRYCSSQAIALEKQHHGGNFKRIRMQSGHHHLRNVNRTSRPPVEEEFMPVEGGGMMMELEMGDGEMKDASLEGESWEDYVMRCTREYNTLTRERPQDESVWLAFAHFQDELIQAAHKKGAKQQAVDKKLSVLEKALEIHGESEELTLIYLRTCSLRHPVAELLHKWENFVATFSGSYQFWKAFLRFRSAQFSLFSVSSLRSVFVQALRALSAARNRLLDSKGQEELQLDKGPVRDAELAMVAILADRCRFEAQTGHAELALGLYQAALEFSLFAPLVQLTESNKRRLFEAFWDSKARRVGEEGALGWAAWLEREEENFQVAQAQQARLAEEHPGGWSGWKEGLVNENNSSKLVRQGDNDDEEMVEAAAADDDEKEDDDEEAQADEDEAALLAKLGLSSIDAGKELEVTHVSVWQRWGVEERLRGTAQWLPVREQTLTEEQEEEEELERMVAFEDIRDCLFSITSESALCHLVGHFLEFCNLSLPHWCSSNDHSNRERLEDSEKVTGSLLLLLENQISGHMADRSKKRDQGAHGESLSEESLLGSLVGDLEWFLESDGRAQFVCNALLLFETSPTRTISKIHWSLTERLLTVKGVAANNGAIASHALAKKLLKTHPQDLALWSAYAIVEGAAGHLEVARKVFDTTIGSLPALSKEARVGTPLLYLAYADMEVSHGCTSRALHILCFFGSGLPYSSVPTTGDVPPTLIVNARLGFQKHLQNVRRTHTYVQDMESSYVQDRFRHGRNLDEHGMAMVACVALFEELSAGWKAAASVFEESLAFTLPGKRQQSKECEVLMERYTAMMERNMPDVKPSQARRIMLRGVVEYPYNPLLLSTYAQTTASTYHLRRFFDDSSERNPSTMLWMFALSTELHRERVCTSRPRVRSLFERALENAVTQQSVVLWRIYLAYEFDINHNADAARRVYFRAIHACPWSKTLWLDGFTRLTSILTAKELSEFQEIMRDKEIRLRTDVYEILLQDAEAEEGS